jgi:NDP-sugar pyrophosphorylase family protein
VNPITFIICAAGEGLRMKEVSENIPKPLLVLNNKTLLEWSIDSLELRVDDQLIIVHRFDFEVDHILSHFQQIYPRVKIHFFKLEKLTSGQAETAYLAKEIMLNERIAIFNSDTNFKSQSLRKMIAQDDIDGIIPCFKAVGNSWSFCKVDENNSVLEVTEKVRISDWCSAGYYYFRKKDYFFDSYLQSLKANTDLEKYIAPLYNQLILEKKEIRIAYCDIFKPMGTPEQLKEFWDISIDEIKLMNIKSRSLA